MTYTERNKSIIADIERGIRQSDIARRFGVTDSAISDVWRRHIAIVTGTSPRAYWRRMGLSERAARALESDRINTLGELRKHVAERGTRVLMRIPNMGVKSVRECLALLHCDADLSGIDELAAHYITIATAAD